MRGDEADRLDDERTDPANAERDRAELFLVLHAQNHSRISAFVHTLVPSWQDAEEIIQDTLVVLWRKFDDFDLSTNFFAWAARIAQYEVLNYRRVNRRKRVLTFDDDVLESLAATAIRQLNDIELEREALEICLQKLAPADREIVRARYQSGGDVHLVAELLQRTAGHAQRVLRSIRSSLIRCVQQRMAEIGA
ncbi:sigma-70 family RNA polymerase sigma factor [Botrimarina mediterranea]|uniref:RNA polymerase sigma factor RpoE n=1 Tax=Botrimarina mediterranea TaxID=2528022 RepID=A0A518KBH1_9BACT|nr:sigma-70 family RNA polymerase sigma factor [Botrimarina mediterranea]QDV75147.1 RNA polymerase sigma factor RpoE [Botrimarina mediterranea]QDV79793.1 RNA polymerase sigma factor RpoE [Planctomycetes bacterium K2D]